MKEIKILKGLKRRLSKLVHQQYWFTKGVGPRLYAPPLTISVVLIDDKKSRVNKSPIN